MWPSALREATNTGANMVIGNSLEQVGSGLLTTRLTQGNHWLEIYHDNHNK